jgi:hypothetical protein
LSRNDRKVAFFGQLLTSISGPSDLSSVANQVSRELDRPVERRASPRKQARQGLLFEEV